MNAINNAFKFTFEIQVGYPYLKCLGAEDLCFFRFFGLYIFTQS